jgi:hypothetical protein
MKEQLNDEGILCATELDDDGMMHDVNTLNSY